MKMTKYWLFSLALLSPALLAGQLINGQDTTRGTPPIRVTTDGQVVTALGECEDDTLNLCRVSLAGADSTLVSSATSTELKEGVGEMIGFYVNSTSSGTITFYDDNDGTCSSGAVSGTITPAVGWHAYPVPFSTAICALTASTINVTFVWR